MVSAGRRRVLVRLLVGVGAVAATLGAGAAVAKAPVIENGGFETGNFTGWAVHAQQDTAEWSVYSAATDPGLPAPPRGTYAATVSENDPSTPVLLQGFTVPKHAALQLFSGYQNEASEFATPHELNAGADSRNMIPNQQYRIDIIRAHAPLRSLAKPDVLMNVFRTKVGDPQTQDPEKFTADLSKLAGRHVKLRFAAANNQLPLLVEIDGVKVKTAH